MSNLFQKLNHQADKHGIDRQQFQTLFYLEHVLKQISESPYHDDFILKGGFELGSLLNWQTRSTVDLDMTLDHQPLDATQTSQLLSRIFAASTDDVRFSVSDTRNIMEDGLYPGLRLTIAVQYHDARSRLKIDISTGDVVYPKPMTLNHQSILGDGSSFAIKAFPLEQIIADKLVTTLLRDASNTRAKDYLDLFVLDQLEWSTLDPELLAAAFRETAPHKGLPALTHAQAHQRIQALSTSQVVRQSWRSFQTKHDFAGTIKLDDAIRAIQHLLSLALPPDARPSTKDQPDPSDA